MLRLSCVPLGCLDEEAPRRSGGRVVLDLFVPRGFAHGFAVLSEEAIFAYKVDNWYAPEYDSGIKWNDKVLQIDWKITTEDVQLSIKDKSLASFKELKSPFKF